MRSLVPVARFISAEKTQSKSKYRQFCDGFALFSPRMNVLLLVFHRELPFICLLLHESVLFFRNFVK